MDAETEAPCQVGSFSIGSVTEGDCRELIPQLPDDSIDVAVTSPPYWGQRLSRGHGNEEDPRKYVFGRIRGKAALT
jgi:DNA modification methylase